MKIDTTFSALASLRLCFIFHISYFLFYLSGRSRFHRETRDVQLGPAKKRRDSQNGCCSLRSQAILEEAITPTINTQQLERETGIEPATSSLGS